MMKRWEYHEAAIDLSHDAILKLDKLGAEGWELVAMSRAEGQPHALFYFKREIDPRRSGPGFL